VEGLTIEPLELFNFLQPRMAHFMLPRFIRVIEALPKTPTLKIKKHLLKEQGVSEDSWDREQAGIKIKRDKIGHE
jgi:crotonobetaine/carnitine-CoA ligase